MTARRSVRALIDLSVAPPGGAGTYAAGLMAGLVEADIADRDQLVVVVDEQWAARYPEPVAALRRAGAVVEPLAFPAPGTWRARLLRGRALRLAAKRHRVDVAFFPREVAPRTGCPHVLLANNLYAWQTFSSSLAVGGRFSAFALRLMARRRARSARSVLAVSSVIVDAMPAGLHVTAVVHHGCDLPEGASRGFDVAPDQPRRVAMVGNLIPNKGIELAIEGVAQARHLAPTWELEVYGNVSDQDYRAQLDDLSTRRLGGSVLVGPAYGDDLVAAYARADLVVMGGTFESFCFPLVEAMRSGCVVVAPACALVDEICGDVAVTYREGDASSLAAALEQGWAERSHRSPLGVERSRRFSWSATAARTVALVRDAVAGAAPASPAEPDTARVLVDLSVAPVGGAGTYVDGFVHGLVHGEIEQLDRVVVVVDRRWSNEHADALASLASTGVVVEDLAFPAPGTRRAGVSRGGLLRAAAQRHRVDLSYFPRDVAPFRTGPYVVLARNLYASQAFRSSVAVGGPLSAFVLRAAARRSASKAVAVLAVSDVMAKALAPRVSVDAVVHHGCLLAPYDRSGLAPSEDGPRRVVMVGNVIANKRIEVVIDGVARARRSGAPWELQVYGGRSDARYAAALDEAAVERLGATVLVGPIRGEALAAAYIQADVLVMGGTFESFCFPLVEAMRSGCVVVAPACALVDEICGDVAVTYREGDASSLAAALEQGWAERSHRSAIGVERSRAFDWAQAVERTIHLLRANAPSR